MRSSATPWLIGAAAALGLGYLFLHDEQKKADQTVYKGSVAKVGDFVSVPVSVLPVAGALSAIAALLPAGTVTGAGFAVLHVDSIGNGMISGPVTHYQVQSDQAGIPLPTILGPYTIPITAVVQVTDPSGRPVA